MLMIDIAEWVMTFFLFSLSSFLFSVSLFIAFHVFLQIIERIQYEG